MNTSKRYVIVKMASLLLCVTLLGSTFVACSSNSNTSTGSAYSTSQSHKSNDSSKKPSKQNLTLAEIKPTFSDTTWHGEKYVKIDEESLLQIIRVAMEDAEKMYISIGSKNMKLDKETFEHTNTFYPDWMNEYFFLSRAKKESVYMIDYIGPAVNDAGYKAHGTMAIIPEYVIPTLNQYMRDTYKCNIRFDDYNFVPSKQDIKNYKNSSEARERLKQIVYDNIYVSICYDIYNAKCSGPNHKDFYVKYGGYDEDIRQKVVTALYLFKRNDVISSLKNGSFLKTYGDSDYVNDILAYQQESKNNHENTIERSN